MATPTIDIPPLGEADARRAIGSALSAIGRRRVRVYDAELHVEKDTEGRPRRLVRVILADLEPYLPRIAIVDPQTAEVVSSVERPDLVIPFSADEIGQAKAIARSEEDLADGMDRGRLAAAIFYPPAPEPEQKHDRHRSGRRIGIVFLDLTGERAQPAGRVVVDLGEGRVVSADRSGRRPDRAS
jgi:hypothetical protein